MIEPSEVPVVVHSFQAEGAVRKGADAVTRAGSLAVSAFPGTASAVAGVYR